MGKFTVLKLALGIKVVTVLTVLFLYRHVMTRKDFEGQKTPLWDKCPLCENSFKNESLFAVGLLSMISGVILSLFLNTLVKEKSQHLPKRLKPGKTCARRCIEVTMALFYVVTWFILVVIVTFFCLNLREYTDFSNDNLRVIGIVSVWLIAFSMMLWQFYWKPILLSCFGLAI